MPVLSPCRHLLRAPFHIVAWLLVTACADAAGGEIDPRAMEVYAKAVQAAKDIHRLDYHAGVGTHAQWKAGGAGVSHFRVQLDFDGAPPGSPARMRVDRLGEGSGDGSADGAQAIESLVVGERDAIHIAPSTREVRRDASWHTVGKWAFGALPEWIFFVRAQADPLTTEWSGATRIVEARFFGTERFDGVACDVIGIEREKDIGSRLDLHGEGEGGVRAPRQVAVVRELLAIAQTDRLPRSVSIVELGAVDAKPPADLRDAAILRLTKVRAGSAFAADTFSTAVAAEKSKP